MTSTNKTYLIFINNNSKINTQIKINTKSKQSLKKFFNSLKKFISPQFTIIFNYYNQNTNHLPFIIYNHNIHIKSKQNNHNINKIIFQ